ncbi:MAG TPA: hypothetical protein PKW95_01665 [bacterium]|nr:hypothetical protein [bacterium]
MKQEQKATTSKIPFIILCLLLIVGGGGLLHFWLTGFRIGNDCSGDGLDNCWSYFNLQGQMIRFEKDKNSDGNIDYIDHYKFSPELGREHIFRTEADLDVDGKFETISFFDHNEKLTRLERDSNADGRADVISLFDDPEKPPSKVMYDENFDGKFERIKDRTEETPEPATTGGKS